MNHFRFSKLLYVVLLFMLIACQAQVAPLLQAVVPAAVQPAPVLATAPAAANTTFSPKTFNLPISFSYGPGWKLYEEYSNQVSLTYKDYDGYFSFINLKSFTIASPAAPYTAIPFPDDFVTWIQTHGLFHIVKTQPVLVGGLQGTQIDADATPACGTKTIWLSDDWICADGVHYHFIYMDNVNGERLLIMTEGLLSAQDFMVKVDASQKVLDTVVFSKP